MASMVAIRRLCLALLACSACLSIATGCQTVANTAPQQPKQLTVTVRAPQSDSASDPPATPDDIEWALNSSRADPCAAHLQRICGILLQYYSTNGRLPSRLEDLNTLPEIKEPLTFSCPGSGKPFVYVPSGLVRLGDARPIVLFDQNVDRAGLRWVIRLRRHTAYEAGMTSVEHVQESVFKTFVPAQ